MKIYLDDLRPAPPGWTQVHSVAGAIELLRCLRPGQFEAISLDHDLGDWSQLGGDAPALLDWMAEHALWPTRLLRIHTANPVGGRRMHDQVVAMVRRFPEQFTDQMELVVEPELRPRNPERGNHGQAQS